MISGSNSCYPYNGLQALPVPLASKEVISAIEMQHANTNNFLYNISLLEEKVHQLQSLASFFISPQDHGQSSSSAKASMSTAAALVQAIIDIASSMILACHQQMNLCANKLPDGDNYFCHAPQHNANLTQNRCWSEGYNYGACYDNTTSTICVDEDNQARKDSSHKDEINGEYEVIELTAADLLAKYTHHCLVCGKGFMRDANLRMHMRAHGDAYKSTAWLCNPVKNKGSSHCKILVSEELPNRYSCPQEGCRWNRKHAKFQPLKSLSCAKNHYKRRHCPKMYVCKRCNRKQFAVVSDLRTHEKHCGELRWQCSCGTTFSRKDKLKGHVALFVGHTPIINWP